MRCWSVGDGNDSVEFTRITKLRDYLVDHPEVEEVKRYIWHNGDLVDTEYHSREDILGS